jgi:hypothetical protein
MAIDQEHGFCSSPVIAPGKAGAAVSPRARLCALAAAIVCGGIAGPGVASAADSLGIENLTNQAETLAYSEINGAVADQGGVVAHAIATSVPRPAATPPPSAPAADEGAIEVTVPAAAEPIVSAALAPVSTLAATGSASAPTSTAPTPPERRREVAGSGRRGRPQAALRAPTGLPLVLGGSPERTAFAANGTAGGERAVLTTGSDARGRSATRARREAPAGAGLPQPFPPVPLPPRPDLSPAGQVGGQGLLLPLLLAALAAALAGFAFHFLPRDFPRPAFRKPRRIALQVWHPG